MRQPAYMAVAILTSSQATGVVCIVVSLLAANNAMSTGEIARAIGRSTLQPSNILDAFRLAEL